MGRSSFALLFCQQKTTAIQRRITRKISKFHCYSCRFERLERLYRNSCTRMVPISCPDSPESSHLTSVRHSCIRNPFLQEESDAHLCHPCCHFDSERCMSCSMACSRRGCGSGAARGGIRQGIGSYNCHSQAIPRFDSCKSSDGEIYHQLSNWLLIK